MDTWAEQKINKALAMELVEELSGTQELVQLREEYMRRANAIMDVVGEFRSEGENLFKDNTTRWRFAQKMDGLLPGRQASQFNNMLQEVQAVWQAVDDAYKAAGQAIDAADFIATVLMLNEYYRVYIEALMPYVPTETRLYNGLSQLSQQMNEPLETFVEDLAKEKVLKEYGKLSSDALLGFASDGSTLVAGIIFKTMGALIQTPTIDAYNKAWLSVANVTVVHGMMRDKATQIANSSASYRWSQEPTFKLISASYFVALEKALGYVAATQDDSAYLKQLFSRYEGALTYSAYIRSCKELVAENGS